MTEKKFRRYFWNVTRAVLTPILAACFGVLRLVLGFACQPELAMRLYHAFPRMAECILTGAAVYLAYALTVTKIQLSSPHDEGGSGIQ